MALCTLRSMKYRSCMCEEEDVPAAPPHTSSHMQNLLTHAIVSGVLQMVWSNPRALLHTVLMSTGCIAKWESFLSFSLQRAHNCSEF